MNNPLVSIIVPVYNQGELLCQCVDSVLEQTLGNIELVIVNDASTDDTQAYIDDFSSRDSRVVVHQHRTNLGRGEARNTGVDHSTGKYIFFLDSDDSLPPDAIETLSGIAETHGSDLVLGKTRSAVDVDHTYIKCNLYNITIRNYPELLHNHAVWNKLIRRKILEDSGIRFIAPRYAEDILFSLKLNLECHAISITTKVTYNYRWGKQVPLATKGKLIDAQKNIIEAYRNVERFGDPVLLGFMRKKTARNIFWNMRRAQSALDRSDLAEYLGNWNQVVDEIPDNILKSLLEPNGVFIRLIKQGNHEGAIRYWRTLQLPTVLRMFVRIYHRITGFNLK